MISGFYPIVKTFANYTTVDEIILNPRILFNSQYGRKGTLPILFVRFQKSIIYVRMVSKF
jgi:hypothetical protein